MSDRRKHWQAIYRDRSPEDVSWFQPCPALSLEMIEAARVPSAEGVIDVGGGASTLVDHLLQRGFQRLTVLDISAHALAAAQARLGKAARSVEWLEADITTFETDRSWWLWHDRAVFHFLTEASDRKSYLRALRKSLQPGGQLIIAAFAVGGPTRCSGLEIVQYDAARLQDELGADFELLETRSEAHVTPSQSTQDFNYFRLRYRP